MILMKVLQDLCLLVGSETSARHLERWPSYKPKLIKERPALQATNTIAATPIAVCQGQMDLSVDNLQVMPES
ncbi:hypothetical protein AALO_G00217030 [Alosa alosa]|uniref:Uncharacterized protein n=1 Tax=Alosa alosa TaxID=278164 RepID=A0AAV6G620_9TELE|nr:hypothetical protein AALO_G00217030 [Alosa alosa]